MCELNDCVNLRTQFSQLMGSQKRVVHLVKIQPNCFKRRKRLKRLELIAEKRNMFPPTRLDLLDVSSMLNYVYTTCDPRIEFRPLRADAKGPKSRNEHEDIQLTNYAEKTLR